MPLELPNDPNGSTGWLNFLDNTLFNWFLSVFQRMLEQDFDVLSAEIASFLGLTHILFSSLVRLSGEEEIIRRHKPKSNHSTSNQHIAPESPSSEQIVFCIYVF